MDGVTRNVNFLFSNRFRSELETLEEFCTNTGIPGFEVVKITINSLTSDPVFNVQHNWGCLKASNHPGIFASLLRHQALHNGNSGNTFLLTDETGLRFEKDTLVFSLSLDNKEEYFLIYFLNHEVQREPLFLSAITPVTRFLRNALNCRLDIDTLLEEKAKYRHLFSAAPEGIVMLDRNNCVLECNPEFEQMFQYSGNQIIGQNIDDLIAPGSLNEEARLYSRSNWTGMEVAIETKRMRRDTQLLDVSVMGVPFYRADGQLRVFGIYRDITQSVNEKQQKQSRIEFVEFIGRFSSQLINLDISNIDEIIKEALQKVAELYGAERAFIALLNEEKNLINVSHEYTQNPRYSRHQLTSGISLDEVREFINELIKDQVLYLQRADVVNGKVLPDLLYYFDLLDIETLVTIPLFGEQRFLGYIGFDTYSRPMKWDENPINAFKLTAQIMANALARKKREGALKDALIKAEASDRLKTAFLAGISHEIRTPMNHIMGFLEMLDEPEITEEERTEYIDIMKSSSNRLLQLVDDVIKIALIDSGQLHYQPGPCNLIRFMETLQVEAEGARMQLHRMEVRLNLAVEQSMRGEVIETDEAKLKQILWNLLTNAMKFTPEGNIDFGFTCLRGKVEFFVRDTGIGIEPASQEAIFERFHREENAFAREYGGTGLGLSISQGLARLLGDPIHVNSVPGKGATFSFSIPYKEYKQLADNQSAPLPGRKIPDWQGKRILMVEDDPINMRFLAVMLLPTNADLLYAANGAEAVDLVKSTPIDLVLMDMQLPVMDGFEATRQIKKHNENIPVIAQTAMALREEKQQCLDAGCDVYLSKPMSRQQLYSAIDGLLNALE